MNCQECPINASTSSLCSEQENTYQPEDYENLSWKDKETALLQPVIDISCIVSVTAAVGMTATYTTIQKIALIFNSMMRCSDLKYKN